MRAVDRKPTRPARLAAHRPPLDRPRDYGRDRAPWTDPAPYGCGPRVDPFEYAETRDLIPLFRAFVRICLICATIALVGWCAT